MKVAAITVELTDAESMALAQFLKRVGWLDYRQLAIDDQEAVRKVLSEVGYAPR